MNVKNMILTLKSLYSGVFTVKIQSYDGKTSYRQFTSEELQQYILDMEAYAEYYSLNLPKFIIPEGIKKMCKQWLEGQAKANNNE